MSPHDYAEQGTYVATRLSKLLVAISELPQELEIGAYSANDVDGVGNAESVEFTTPDGTKWTLYRLVRQ